MDAVTWDVLLERWTTIAANLIVILGIFPFARWATQTLAEARAIRTQQHGASELGLVERADFQHIQLLSEQAENLWDIQWSPIPLAHTPPEQVRKVRAEITSKRLRGILARSRSRLGRQQIVVGSVRLNGAGSGIVIAEVARLDYAMGDEPWRKLIAEARRRLARWLGA